MSINENDPLYKPLSAIYGAFLADSMGSYCEFKKYNKENYKKVFSGKNIFNEEPGHATDDSEMAMSLAYAIMDNSNINNIDSNYIFFYYAIWRMSFPKDIGRTISTALNNFKNSSKKIDTCFNNSIKKIINTVNHDSLANGSLMRNSPLTVWYYFTHKTLIENILKKRDNININNFISLYYDIAKYSKVDCETTHPNPEIASANALVIILSICAIRGLSNMEMYDIIKKLIQSEFFIENNKNLAQKWNGIINEIEDTDILKNYYNNWFKSFSDSVIGYYMHSIRIILFCLYHLDFFKKISKEYNCTLYEAIIYEICNYGGDTDTNAAIVGSVIGPMIGFSNFGDNVYYSFNCIDNSRVIYTNAAMYFYVYYLKLMTENKIEVSSDTAYNTERTYNLFCNLNSIPFN